MPSGLRQQCHIERLAPTANNVQEGECREVGEPTDSREARQYKTCHEGSH